MSSEIWRREYNNSYVTFHICMSLLHLESLFVCVEVLRPSQPNGVMLSAVSFPNHTLLGRLSPLSG